MKTSQITLTLSQIEFRASASEATVSEFRDALWVFLSTNKAAVKALAKELNIYPTLGNVNQAVDNHFFQAFNL